MEMMPVDTFINVQVLQNVSTQARHSDYTTLLRCDQVIQMAMAKRLSIFKWTRKLEMKVLFDNIYLLIKAQLWCDRILQHFELSSEIRFQMS